MNKEIIRVINYLSPDDPSRSVNYDFSQWALDNFDRISAPHIISKIEEMIDDVDSGLCLKFGKQWVQSNKSKIIDACKNLMGLSESPDSPIPMLREDLKHLSGFGDFLILGKDTKVVIPTPTGNVEILAKVDTGAYSTSLDESFFKSLNLDEKVLKNKVIKNVHGEESRDVYEIELIIEGKRIVSELNVFDRSEMGYKMIIGRKDIKSLKAIVDITKNESMKYIKKFNESEEFEYRSDVIANSHREKKSKLKVDDNITFYWKQWNYKDNKLDTSEQTGKIIEIVDDTKEIIDFDIRVLPDSEKLRSITNDKNGYIWISSHDIK